MEERYKELKQGERGAQVSLVAYIILAILKLTVGIYAGSIALRADGLNNVTDVVVAIAVLIGLRVSQKPPDKDHLWPLESRNSCFSRRILHHYGRWDSSNH